MNILKSKFKLWIFALIVLVLIITVGIYYTLNPDKNPVPKNYDDFSKCLNTSGTKMYGAYWCPHCNSQKNVFGESKQYLPYVECAIANVVGQSEECTNAGVEYYPTWIFNNKDETKTKKVGFLSFKELSDFSGCEL